METSDNLILSEKMLNSGESECPRCHIGKFKPLNPECSANHCFICENCGERLTIEPNVIVD